MSRALLRRVEQLEQMFGVTEQPVTVRILGLEDGRMVVKKLIHMGGPGTSPQAQGAGKNGCVRMMQIEPNGEERTIEIGPAPARGGKGRAKARKNGRGRRGGKNAK